MKVTNPAMISASHWGS